MGRLGLDAGSWALSLWMAFELCLPGADLARLTGPGHAVMAGMAGRGCDYVAHHVPIKGQAWHYLSCSGYYLRGTVAGCCLVQRCRLSIAGLLLPGSGHKAAAPWGLPPPGTSAIGGCSPWDRLPGHCRYEAGLLFCFHHLHLQEDAISLQLCLSG